MKKQGVSPLLSWVLLIGFVITMAAVIAGWAIKQVEDIPVVEGPETYCNDVGLELHLDEVDTGNPGFLKVQVTNKGKFTIKRVTMQREIGGTGGSAFGSCSYLNFNDGGDGGLIPGEVDNESFKLTGKDISSVNDCNSLNNLGSCTSNEKITTFSLVPWIEIEGKDMSCSGRKVSLATSSTDPLDCPV